MRRFLEASHRAEIVALLNAAPSAADVARVVVEGVGEMLEAEVVFLLAADRVNSARTVLNQTGLRERHLATLRQDGPCERALERPRAQLLNGADLLDLGTCQVVLCPWTATDGRRILLGVARLYDARFEPSDVALLEAITESTGHALERAWLNAERDHRAAHQAALVRAAKALNASLVRTEVLETVCAEVSEALAADVVAVYFGSGAEELSVVAGHGVPGEALGAGQPVEAAGISAGRTGRRVVLQPRADDGEVDLGLRGVTGVRSAIAVPARRYAEADGALVVGFHAARPVQPSEVELLAGFAELAGAAYRNADEHTALQRAAMLDSLTGCLNHGAFQSRLREEMERAERTGRQLTVVSIDLDDFKAVNDQFGHLTGDALLRTLAEILRDAVRSYDQVGRLGGDEFMLLLPVTGEGTARRVLDRVGAVLAQQRLPDGAEVTVSAGVAQWRSGDDANQLIDRADHALLEAKARRRGRPERQAGGRAGSEGDAERHQLERLATAGALGARLARLTDQRTIVETALDDLRTHLGYERCSLSRDSAGTAHEELAEWHPAPVSAGANASGPIRSELSAAVTLQSVPWGTLTLSSSRPDAFDAADAQILQRVSDHVGSALRTAELQDSLEQSYLGTAEALAAALEAKDHYTADHARSVAGKAVALGRALKLSEQELRDLRYGALFHDIGKIAIPDAILSKQGPLDEAEMSTIRQHPLVGERILAPVAFLTGVRQVVRHDHERWDGTGYPDGLRGQDIPLGARIVFAVDAFHAMTSDRPYRKAMSPFEAREEMQRHAGTQFDPEVVRALFATLDAEVAEPL